MFALLGSVLFFAASAHLGDEPAPSDGRRLAWVPSSQPIWGDCLTPLGEEGCSPGGGFQCSDRLSPGPEDADVELVIKDLPPSSAQEPVHLQFWSPRKSPTRYNPLVSLVNCSIYQDVLDAYPHFDAGDFNGGNVLVSETGEATIRVRSPGMYMILWKLGDAFLWEIRLPHIHLRLCHGTDFLLAPAHIVQFGEGSIQLAGTHRPLLRLLSAGPYADRLPSPPYNTSAPAPVKIVVSSTPTTQQSTTLPPTATTDLPSPSLAPTPTPSPTPSPTPTPSPSPTPSPVPTPSPSPTPSPVPAPVPVAMPTPNGVLIDAAKSALDLDALEFSPVYRCLLDKAFFDHFSSSCSDECPAEAVVKHGQCVHAETDDELAEVAVTWKLEIDCGEPCWHDKKLVSLHNVRLSAADLLNVPFQEVKVEMGFLSSGSRRLADARVAYLTVEVTSNRVAAEAASAELQEFVRNVVFISQLLGLDVLKAEVVPRPDGQFLEEPVKMDQDNDPYEPAYKAIEPGPVTGGSGVLSFLPTSAIVGIAAGVVLVLSILVGSLVLRRRCAQRAAREANIQAKVNEKVADEKAADPEEANPNAEATPEELAN